MAQRSVALAFSPWQSFERGRLAEPNFVGSLERGPYVYFFFRENAVEVANCGAAIYSRVARICKVAILSVALDGFQKLALQNDVGGRYILKQNWATFVKARLNCSLPGDYPFYFNEIRSPFLCVSNERLQ